MKTFSHPGPPLKYMLRHAVAAIFLLAAVSCATAPAFIVRPDGTHVVSLGTSIFEKAASESALVSLPDGTQLEYAKTEKDQTGVANTGITAWGTVESLEIIAGAVTKARSVTQQGKTARQLSGDSVRKARVAADVTKHTFVPPIP